MNDTRTTAFNEFLVASGWQDARISKLAGDASNRRYVRLNDDGRKAILMDAPPEKGEDIRPFVHVANYLICIGLSAPEIMATDLVDQRIC